MVHTERLYVSSCMRLDGLCLCVVCGCILSESLCICVVCGRHMCTHGVDV